MPHPRPLRARPARVVCAGLLALALVPLPSRAAAQDLNILFPIPEIEQKLRTLPFEILSWTGSRRPEDRTQRVTLGFTDSSALNVKWASAPHGGGEFNNEPRYELAAYEIQKLFLAEDEYVVPPTVLRALPTAFVRQRDPRASATFPPTQSTVVVLQYWLSSVTPDGFWDERRFARDTAYARFLANFNVLTYLVFHNDENQGNFLIALDSLRPRVFSVDNGISFRSLESDRGHAWRRLRVDRIPAHTAERLRAITPEALERTLGVVAEFQAVDGQLAPVPPGPNLGPYDGVRSRGGRIQFGLTAAEIADTRRRLQQLVKWLDEGRIRTF